jgi:alpha-beta hydrolase superfamily lysophospholipase
MKREEFTIRTSDGLHLFAATFEPEDTAHGHVCLVHGIGEHFGRYAGLIEFMTDAGFGLTTFDLRGHGRSEGPIAHSPSLGMLMEDIDLVVSGSIEAHRGIPHFIFGHSMGACLVLNYVLRRRPHLVGAIAASPGLRTTRPTPVWKMLLGRILSAIRPSHVFYNGLRAEDQSRDPEVVRALRSDPFYRFLISARLGMDVIQAGEWAIAHASEFPIPLLLMHGTADRVTSWKATEEFAGKVPGDCTLKLWDGLYHELHNEPEKEQVLGYAVQWMRQTCEEERQAPG